MNEKWMKCELEWCGWYGPEDEAIDDVERNMKACRGCGYTSLRQMTDTERLAAENARLREQVAEAVGLINHFFKIETPNEYTIWYEDMSKFSAMMEAKDDTD